MDIQRRLISRMRRRSSQFIMDSTLLDALQTFSFSSGYAGNTAKMHALPPNTRAEHPEQLRSPPHAVLHAEPLP